MKLSDQGYTIVRRNLHYKIREFRNGQTVTVVLPIPDSFQGDIEPGVQGRVIKVVTYPNTICEYDRDYRHYHDVGSVPFSRSLMGHTQHLKVKIAGRVIPKISGRFFR